jgi:hypothetical protein
VIGVGRERGAPGVEDTRQVTQAVLVRVVAEDVRAADDDRNSTVGFEIRFRRRSSVIGVRQAGAKSPDSHGQVRCRTLSTRRRPCSTLHRDGCAIVIGGPTKRPASG